MIGGRFAPTPSGPLHFGSLTAALAAWCSARQQGLPFQIRIDDIDPPREQPGAADSIIATLKRYGIDHDGPVQYQSERIKHYEDRLHQLAAQGRAYRCSCSRRQLGAGLYDGHCLRHPPAAEAEAAWRLHLGTNTIHFEDRIQGPQRLRIGVDVADPIIWRRDGLVAYTLASAVDDAEYTQEVVRGADLLPATAAQHVLIQYLDIAPPAWAHIPVALDAHDEKLAKHKHAAALDGYDPLVALRAAWLFLGQRPLIEANSPQTFLQEARQRWSEASVPKRLSQTAPALDKLAGDR